jgi:homocysteine S-methyltransferase
MDLLDELNSNVLAGDGGMGTLLMESGVPADVCFEELCVSQPELVGDIHAKFIAVGARVIRTNSFSANAVRLARYGMEHRVNELNWSAAQVARDVARGKGVYVAGSVGPTGIAADHAKEQGISREDVFREQIGALLDGGVNLVFFEMFTDLDELLLALYVKQSLHHQPVICSLACSEDGSQRPKIHLREVFAKLRKHDADVMGLNCPDGPQALARLLEPIPAEGPLAAYPDAAPGHGEVDLMSPGDFANSTRGLVAKGARLIGGCRGVGSRHIQAIVAELEGIDPDTVRCV